MKSIYQAAHGVDAHMVKGLLEQAGIPAQVRGEYLQGALGELPVNGMVTVWVGEPDALRAREILRDWEHSAPEETPGVALDAEPAPESAPRPRSSPRARATAFVAALLLIPVVWWAFTRLMA